MNPNLDKRRTRINRAKRHGHCNGCGGVVRLWFACSYCDRCLGEMTSALIDTRRNKPSLVRYYR